MGTGHPEHHLLRGEAPREPTQKHFVQHPPSQTTVRSYQELESLLQSWRNPPNPRKDGGMEGMEGWWDGEMEG